MRSISAGALGSASNSVPAAAGSPISRRFRAASAELVFNRDNIRIELVAVTVTSSIQYLKPAAVGLSSVSKFNAFRSPAAMTKILESLGIIAAVGLIRTSYKGIAAGFAVCSGSLDF